MQSKIKMLLAMAAVLVTTFWASDSMARPAVSSDKEAKLQANYTGAWNVRRNTVSNIQFYTSNYGIFGLDVARNVGGGMWPRGSLNQYIFGGGIWFGAQKWATGTDGEPVMRKYAVVSYDPNNGESWLIPGRIEQYDGTVNDVLDENNISLYRLYMSTDFNRSTGTPTTASDGENWPIWDTESLDDGYILSYDRYFGRFVNNPTLRNTNTYPKGPAFITEEDIFASFKDTDLGEYKMGATSAKKKGYPLRLQFEQMIYSWGFGDYKDFIFIKYDIINMSDDSLRECWMSPMMDVDVARSPYTNAGATNDRVKYYKPSNWDTDPTYKDTLNLAMQWTTNTQGEDGKGFGYLGYDFLESPSILIPEGDTTIEVNGAMVPKKWMWSTYAELKAGEVDPNSGLPVPNDTTIGLTKVLFDKELAGFVRKDKRYYETKEQLGLVSFRNWNIEQDKKTDEDMYNFMSEIGDNGYIRDGDEGPGDKRFMMATGPFAMLPKDTVRVVVGIMIALPSVQREADGSEIDVAGLVKLDMFAQSVYDNNFRAPAPPQNTVFLGYKSYNNAIEVSWDSTAEYSSDAEEQGLDFMGYALYRSRDPNLDTFNVDAVSASENYTKGRGPFGWKRVASWEMPKPFSKSGILAEENSGKDLMPQIDYFDIVGFGFENGVMDTMSLTIMRRPVGLIVHANPDSTNGMYATPILERIDEIEGNPWSSYFAGMWKPEFAGYQMDPTKPINERFQNEELIDSVLYGKLIFNSALMNYNPLYWRPITVPAMALLADETEPDNVSKRTWEPFYPGFDTDEAFKDKYARMVEKNSGPNGGDTIYLYKTVKAMELNGRTGYYFTKMVPLWDNTPESWQKIFKSPTWVAETQETIMDLIQQGYIQKVQFADVAGSKKAKDEVIVPYMSKITNGRKFYDTGDDNGTGVVDLSDESTNTEKILNNIEYYYKLEAYDEGDWTIQNEGKWNDGSVGRSNNINAYAKAGRPDDNTEFEITYVDENKMGGLKNFKFFTINDERANQKLQGKTLELEFNPYVTIKSLSVPSKTGSEKDLTLYYRNLIVKDSATGEKIFEQNIPFDPNGGMGLNTFMEAYTENAFSALLADSAVVDTIGGTVNEFALPTNNDKDRRIGSFTTGKFSVEGFPSSYSFTNGYENLFGFSFDFAMEQRGGVIRTESIEKLSGDATTTVAIFNDDARKLTVSTLSGDDCERYAGSQVVALEANGMGDAYVKGYYPQRSEVARQWNTGPGEYVVTFKEGGNENITVTYNNYEGSTPITTTFNVPYLTYDITNRYNFSTVFTDGSEQNVRYGFKYDFMEVPETLHIGPYAAYKATENSAGTTTIIDYTCYFPHPKNLGLDANNFMGRHTSFACGFVNGRGKTGAKNAEYFNMVAVGEGKTLDQAHANVVGRQGRYYLSATNGDATIDFVNVLNISGAMFMFDYAYRGTYCKTNLWNRPTTMAEWTFGEDFKVGDQVLAKVTGGCFGMPVTGAKVRAKLKSTAVANNDYTESQLERVKVVPNPYYISHEAQKSAYDTKLYFTKLPSKCTIDIYTATGDLVRTINHDEVSGPYNEYDYAMDVWDLYSSNAQRVQSQTFVAVITTPNGEQTPIKFSVVVGSTRLIAD